MPKDSYYIKLDTNAPEDTKVKVLRKYHGMAGFGCYIFLALKLRQEEACQLEYSDFTFEALSVDMGKTLEEVKQFIDDCIKFKLLKKNGDHFYSERIRRDKAWLDEKRANAQMAGKISAERRWGKGHQEIETIKQASMPKMAALITNELKTEFSELDIDEELKKFTLYWSEGKRKLQRPKTAFRNWLIKAREFKQEKPNRTAEQQPAKPVRRTYNDGNTEGMVIL